MTTDTASERFAIITSRRIDTPAGDYRPHYKTCGHTNPHCRAIMPDSTIIAYKDSFSEFMAGNEYFDGEVIYAAPFRCRVCHPDVCNVGVCNAMSQCSKHSAQYQRRYGRAFNE